MNALYTGITRCTWMGTVGHRTEPPSSPSATTYFINVSCALQGAERNKTWGSRHFELTVAQHSPGQVTSPYSPSLLGKWTVIRKDTKTEREPIGQWFVTPAGTGNSWLSVTAVVLGP